MDLLQGKRAPPANETPPTKSALSPPRHISTNKRPRRIPRGATARDAAADMAVLQHDSTLSDSGAIQHHLLPARPLFVVPDLAIPILINGQLRRGKRPTSLVPPVTTTTTTKTTTSVPQPESTTAPADPETPPAVPARLPGHPDPPADALLLHSDPEPATAGAHLLDAVAREDALLGRRRLGLCALDDLIVP